MNSYPWAIRSLNTIPSWVAQACGLVIPVALTVHTRWAQLACWHVMLGCQVVVEARWAWIGVWLGRLWRAVVACRAHIRREVGGVSQTVVPNWARFAIRLCGQVLIFTGWTSHGIHGTLYTVVTCGADMSDDRVDAACRTLRVIEHDRVGLNVTRHTVVTCWALGYWWRQVGSCNNTAAHCRQGSHLFPNTKFQVFSRFLVINSGFFKFSLCQFQVLS